MQKLYRSINYILIDYGEKQTIFISAVWEDLSH